jgi:Transglycosylase SLT domain
MSVLVTRLAWLRAARQGWVCASPIFARGVGRGMIKMGLNGLAVVGLLLITTLALMLGGAQTRGKLEEAALDWLQSREEARAVATDDVPEPAPEGGARATATDLAALPRPQATLAQWIARRYKVAPEPVAALVQEAWHVGQRANLDPTLILAIMAVESSFNPFAQSAAGAQGLMQVHTKVHDDKFVAFGGQHAAFDPISNLRVGVQVLKDCINRAGSVQEGLRHYVGAALLDNDEGYAKRVLAEQGFMRGVADGKRVPVTAMSKVKPAEPPVSAPVTVPSPLTESVALLR